MIAYDVQFTESQRRQRRPTTRCVDAVARRQRARSCSTTVSQHGRRHAAVFGGKRYSPTATAVPGAGGRTSRTPTARVAAFSTTSAACASFDVAAADRSAPAASCRRPRQHRLDRLRRPAGIDPVPSASSTSATTRSTPQRCAARSSSSAAPRLAAGSAQHSTDGNVLMPGPRSRLNAIHTALEGFPLRDAPGLDQRAADHRARLGSPRSPRLRLRVLRAAWSSRLRAGRASSSAPSCVPACRLDRHRHLSVRGRASPAILADRRSSTA